METPAISIIVPVYNTEKYLPQCLNSLINQTLKEIEIICVNDGSMDRSLNIIQDFQKKDNRIIIVNQKNQGLSQVRNKGLERASGKYFTFVDSDDWLDLDACEQAYLTAEKNNCDVIMYSYIREYEQNSLPNFIFDKDTIFYENHNKKIWRSFIGVVGEELKNPQKKESNCSSCTKLYRLDIVRENNLKYVDTKIIGTYEDGLFNLEYFKFVKKSAYINKCFYHYRKTNTQSLTTIYRADLYSKWKNLYYILEKYIKDNNLKGEYIQALQNRISLDLIGLGLNLIASDKHLMGKVKEIEEIINSEQYKTAITTLEIKNMPIHWRIFFISARKKMSIVILVLLIVMNKLRSKI